HPNIGEENEAVVQSGRDFCALCLGNFADLLEICVWVLCCEVEHFLHDTRDGFSMPIGDSKQAQIIAFTEQCIGCSHVTARNHGPPPDCHQVNDHERDEKDRQ